MPDDPIRQANRLYWESDDSVAEIARRLELSRRALYDAIQPRSAPGECPECGTLLVFRNRTSLTRGNAECLECEIEVAVDVTGDAEPGVEQELAASAMSPLTHRRRAEPTGGALMAVALLAGLAAGAATGLLLRRL